MYMLKIILLSVFMNQESRFTSNECVHMQITNISVARFVMVS